PVSQARGRDGPSLEPPRRANLKREVWRTRPPPHGEATEPVRRARRPCPEGEALERPGEALGRAWGSDGQPEAGGQRGTAPRVRIASGDIGSLPSVPTPIRNIPSDSTSLDSINRKYHGTKRRDQ